jgi:hypothetical protein
LLSSFLVHVISEQGLSIYVSDLAEQFFDGTHALNVQGRFVFSKQMGTGRHLRANVLAQDGQDVGSQAVRIFDRSFSDALDDQREHLLLSAFKLVLT